MMLSLPTACEWRNVPGGGLWLKRDDLCARPYAGNKARKLHGILQEARRRGVRRLLTVGSAGSHHVLATALYGRAAGLAVQAYLSPQPDSEQARHALRRSVASGAVLWPVGSEELAGLRQVLAFARRAPDTLVVPVGGSSLAGSLPYVRAAAELVGQAEGAQEIVVACGSGGTAAGLAVGALLADLPLEVRAVAIARPLAVVRALTLGMAWRLLAAHGALGRWTELRRCLRFVVDEVGQGYAQPTEAAAHALRVGAAAGVQLDAIYTGKAFAHALQRVLIGRRVVFWHTLSTVDAAPLDRGAPDWSALPAPLRALLR